MSAETVIDQFQQDRRSHVEDLSTLVRIPSVSASGFDPGQVVLSAKAVADLLRRRGLENVELLTLEEGVAPYVYGDWMHATDKPTVLFYAHHDVQPPGRDAVWKTRPFEATLGSDGRLYGRGAADDKAGIVAHTAMVWSWLEAQGKLPVNVKVIIEGEEEIGSPHLYDFLNRYRDKLAADVMVLTDAGNWDTGIPALTTLLRGIVTVEIEVRALEGPLHSGMWGGPVPDPTMALVRMLASLTDASGRIAVPGVYDDVRPLSAKERQEFERLPTSEAEFRRQARVLPGVELLGKWINPWEPIWRQPALAINAFQAASREQAANIICDTAWARVGIRIVPDQDPAKVQKQLLDHLKKQEPWGMRVEYKAEHYAGWWMTEPVGPVFDKARRALQLGYGKEPLMMGCGGSIPFVDPFARALGGVPALLVGVEDPYTNAHAENESLHLGDFEKAVASQIHLLALLAE
jgi:acetylornithine deacetylase/succinyl-diaminopimelate desuccinylase-like protein